MTSPKNTRAEIAEIVGVSESTVNRAVKRAAEEKLQSTEGKVESATPESETPILNPKTVTTNKKKAMTPMDAAVRIKKMFSQIEALLDSMTEHMSRQQVLDFLVKGGVNTQMSVETILSKSYGGK